MCGFYYQVNTVEGTANLAQVVRDAGPNCRFVLISSLVVREPQLSAYAASKWVGGAGGAGSLCRS